MENIRMRVDESTVLLQKKMEEATAAIDPDMRAVFKSVFECSIRCCDNRSLDQDRFQNCLQECSFPVQKAQQHIESEVTTLQNRYVRCASQCQEDLQDLMRNSTDGSISTTGESQVIRCFEDCSNKHVQLIQPMMERVRAILTQR
eukprot:m.21063 g.21063  ORF g.21063 m.21063 type:complete len:145 (+) comp13241_c0_seq1:92-526(+)